MQDLINESIAHIVHAPAPLWIKILAIIGVMAIISAVTKYTTDVCKTILVLYVVVRNTIRKLTK